MLGSRESCEASVVISMPSQIFWKVICLHIQTIFHTTRESDGSCLQKSSPAVLDVQQYWCTYMKYTKQMVFLMYCTCYLLLPCNSCISSNNLYMLKCMLIIIYIHLKILLKDVSHSWSSSDCACIQLLYQLFANLRLCRVIISYPWRGSATCWGYIKCLLASQTVFPCVSVLFLSDFLSTTQVPSVFIFSQSVKYV